MVAEADSEREHSEAGSNAEAAAEEAESSSDEEPARRTPPPPQPVHRCARCASTHNLELLLPTGRWVNLPMEQRLFCDVCIEAAAAP